MKDVDNEMLETPIEENEDIESTSDSNINQNTILVSLISLLLGGGLASIFWGRKYWRMKRELKKAQKNNIEFQEIIRKHQAIIDELKNEKERIEYMYQLLVQLQNSQEGT